MKPSLYHLLFAAVLLGSALTLRAQDAKQDQNQEAAQKPTPVETQKDADADDSDAADHDAIKMQAIEVLGTHIHRVDVEGPSPVYSYDQDYIKATGAMTLADFLNKLPQNYTGISAGRGSAPNELNPEFGQRTETSFPSFNYVLGASAAPPGQTGVSGVSLRGLGSGSTLVLIDGRRAAKSGVGNSSTDSHQGFVDLNTIPLGMIDHIEIITDGASAIYGADAVAGVINIVLKKDWTGSELSASYKGSFDGGGEETQVSLTTGFASGKLRGIVSLEYYNRQALKASERSFSANQDHSAIVAGYDASTGAPIYGRDLRLHWGFPGVVQAVSGNLNGIQYNGAPTRYAIIKPGITGTATLNDFIGATSVSFGARDIVRGNTSEFLDLIPKSNRYGASAYFNYAFNDQVEFFSRVTFTDTRGVFNTQPGVTSASTYSGFGNVRTVVPAAYNPFGQDIIVGQVQYGFGSVNQETRTKSSAIVVGAKGTIGDSWHWDAAYTWNHQRHSQVTRDFNGAPITSLLASGKLNPFIDPRVTGNPQAEIYESMAIFPYVKSSTYQSGVDVKFDGTLFELPGGPLQTAFGGAITRNLNSINTQRFSSGFFGLTQIDTHREGDIKNYASFVEFSVPFFGKPNALPGFRRLDLQLAARYEDRGRAGFSRTPKVGLSWSPVKSLLVRGSYSEGFRAPDLTEYQVGASSYNAYGITDPLRGGISTNGIVVNNGANPNIKPETSTNVFYGMLYEPAFAEGLNLQVNYYRTTVEDTIQVLSAQVLVNNESFFPGRITRDPPDANDLLLGQPGKIIAIDRTLTNFGKVVNESVDFMVQYYLPWHEVGNWTVNLSATHTLTASHELAPGKPAFDEVGDTFSPPKWKFNASVFWSKGPWNGSIFVSRLSSFETNRAGNSLVSTFATPAQTNVDVSVGYTFKNGLFHEFAKGLRVNLGIGNVFDEDPAFSDTVFGYNGALHSPLGRTFQFSTTLPF